MTRRSVVAGVLAFSLLIPTLVAAQITTLSSPQGFSGKETLITFEGQGVLQPTVSALAGVTFSVGSQPYAQVGADAESRPFGPQEPKIADRRPAIGQPLALAFASRMTRVGFELRYNTCNTRASVQFFDGQTAIGTAQSPPSQPSPGPGSPCDPAAWVFAAFESAAPFDRVRLTGPTNGYVRFDNLRFENVR